jgi:hypothetical protein
MGQSILELFVAAGILFYGLSLADNRHPLPVDALPREPTGQSDLWGHSFVAHSFCLEGVGKSCLRVPPNSIQFLCRLSILALLLLVKGLSFYAPSFHTGAHCRRR